jgi:hypothetical protein
VSEIDACASACRESCAAAMADFTCARAPDAVQLHRLACYLAPQGHRTPTRKWAVSSFYRAAELRPARLAAAAAAVLSELAASDAGRAALLQLRQEAVAAVLRSLKAALDLKGMHQVQPAHRCRWTCQPSQCTPLCMVQMRVHKHASSRAMTHSHTCRVTNVARSTWIAVQCRGA